MSATQEVLPILLRSTTPGVYPLTDHIFITADCLFIAPSPVASEKVLIWAQSMREEEPLPPERDADQSEPDINPPDPNWQANEAFERASHRSFQMPRSESSPNSAKLLEDLANSKSGVDYTGLPQADDTASNVQERSQTHSRRSSFAQSNLAQEHPPASKHLSQDTAPSFGNLDTTTFDPKLNGDNASARSVRSSLKMPNINVRSPTPSDPELRGSKHSRAPSRHSHVQVTSIHESDEDSETTKDENDGRTIPVETVRVQSHAGSHKSKSVTSHAPSQAAPAPSDRGRAMSPASVRAKSRASALSPPQSVKSHGARSVGSFHPSQLPLPVSAQPTPTHKSTLMHPLSNYGGSQKGGSSYAPGHEPPAQNVSQHPPSQHAPSQHGGSQYASSHHGPSRAPTAKQLSQAGSVHKVPSQHGGSALVGGSQQPERKENSLHPLSNHPGNAGPYHQYNQYNTNGNGSRYGGSQHSQHTHTPSLHPLTQHLAAQGHRSYSRTSQQSPAYIPPHTAEDMIHAGVRGRMTAVSPTPSNPYGLPQPPPFPYPPPHPHAHHLQHQYMPEYMEETPSQMQIRPRSPDALDEGEQQMVDELLVRTPRTSYTVTPSALAAEVHNSSFHDEDLCILLHAADDDSIHDVVRRAVRKAIRGRVRKLGVKYEAALRRYHSPDGSQREMRLLPQQQPTPQHSERGVEQEEPPPWARDMIALMQETRTRLGDLERKKKSRSYAPTESHVDEGTLRAPRSRRGIAGGSVTNDIDNASPITVTLPMHTPGRTGTIIEESVLVPGETEFTQAGSEHGHTVVSGHHHDGSQHDLDDPEEGEEEDEGGEEEDGAREEYQQEEFETDNRLQRDDSPGKQVLEDAIFHLHSKTPRTDCTHQSWEVQEDTDTNAARRHGFLAPAESEVIADIPDTEEIVSEIPRFEVERKASPGPPAPLDSRESGMQTYQPGEWAVAEPLTPPPWQRIHQRLLNWAIVWPMAELDHALNSTTRGHQVDEIALSIWCTQTYKRYVRARLTEHPPMRVDRLFIPPNVADAVNAAVYNGRHGDACGMLRDMWTPFGLDGMPRLLLVLCKHRREENHWVVHRFSLPDGSLTTYDTYPERSLPDGRPLGWWFAIRIAWPNAMYPSPEHLAQRMVRIHRPMQLGIDNSVATAGIWRNLLMGSKAERSIDLERLRDLINTEVKNLRTRKETGKLSASAPRQHWDDIA